MQSILALLLAATLVVGLAVAESRVDEKCAFSEYRLPERIRPEHYDLRLDVDSDSLTFAGTVGISLGAHGSDDSTEMPRNLIVLHANKTLSIDQVQFEHAGAKPTKVEHVCRDIGNELLVVTLDRDLAAGESGQLMVAFRGAVTDDPDYLMGFYKSKDIAASEDADAAERFILSTQFEADEARQAFPCFDEPSFKATFDVTIVHDPKMTALSNGALESESVEPESGRKVSKFKRTPPMSTYLVAYVIGQLEYIEQVLDGGRLTIRVYASIGRVEKARYTLDIAARAIALMEDYFDVPFAMDKIDMVAIPDFDAGAMENWGLITFAADLFLHDEANEVSEMKAYKTHNIIHEMSHQWFGNLVTMNWWSDLWLNEGFATWMENYFTSLLFPELEWDSYYIRNVLQPALEEDAKSSTHPIRLDVVGGDLNDLFDTITYEKTGAILRFIHDNYLGAETFKQGVRLYIKRHVYGNTEATDLMDALKEASGLPVDELVRSWISQPGYPEIHVELAKSGQKSVLRLTQKRHFSAKQEEETSGQKWMIPISVIVAGPKGNRDTMSLVMDSEESQIELPSWFSAESKSGCWIKLNPYFKGFYRVRYSRDLLMRLKKPCTSKALGTSDRLNIIYDTFADPLPTWLSSADATKVLGWFQEDHEGAILLARYDTLKHLEMRDFLKEKHLRKLSELVYLSCSDIYDKQGFHIGSNEPSPTDADALRWVYKHLVDELHMPLIKTILKEFDKNGNKCNVEVRRLVYYTVGYHGSEKQIEHLRELLNETKDEYERARLESALERASNVSETV